MKLKHGLAPVAGALLLLFTPSSFAEDLFHVHYRLTDLSSDEHNRSGTLHLNVYNTSGEHALDMVAWVTEPNQVTYDQRPIGVGDLADGEQVEVLDYFIVPVEITEAAPGDEQVIWRLEYTGPLGKRRSVDVAGQDVQ